MKLEIIIDKSREETVTVVAHEKNRLVHAIEKLIEENDAQLIGYIERVCSYACFVYSELDIAV